MNIEKFLHFVISHNATIIEVLIGLTLMAILFLSIRMFLLSKETSAVPSVGLDMVQLEATLKQILERAGQVPTAAVSLGEGGSADSADNQTLLMEIGDLKAELEAKKKQIDALKSSTSAPAAAGGLSNEEKKLLESQLQDLQAKLSEYEIISEDIADLSYYKEQNVKLQKEIDALKSGGSAAAAPSAPAPAPPLAQAPASAPEPAIVGRSRVEDAVPETIDEAAVDASLEAAFAATETSPAAAAAESAPVIDDDLMAEFAAAVEKQKSGGSPDEPAAASSVAAAAPTQPPPTADSPSSSDPSAELDLGQMDMDKMLAEASEIKADGPDVDPEKALGTGLDESKLLQEASALESVSSEDKKLMGDFENFVKKNES